MGAEDFRWDDQTWDHVWERLLNAVERHDIAMAVMRKRVPDQPFEGRIAVELARRWRRRAVGLAVLYSLWTLFWGLLAAQPPSGGPGDATALAASCAAAGAVAIACCFAFRRRIAPVAEATVPRTL